VHLQSIEIIQSIELIHNGEIVKEEPPAPKAGQRPGQGDRARRARD
jgi:hypothetical protein